MPDDVVAALEEGLRKAAESDAVTSWAEGADVDLDFMGAEETTAMMEDLASFYQAYKDLAAVPGVTRDAGAAARRQRLSLTGESLLGLGTLLDAFLAVLNGGSLAYLAAGVLVGLTFGVIPGLGGTTALALLIPVTYTLEPLDAMYLAGGVMGATSFGGSISAILLNTRARRPTPPPPSTAIRWRVRARQGSPSAPRRRPRRWAA